MLSLADCFLSLLWITGSSVWLADSDEKMKNRTLCYVVTTLTGVSGDTCCGQIGRHVNYTMYNVHVYKVISCDQNVLSNQRKTVQNKNSTNIIKRTPTFIANAHTALKI